MCSFETVKKAYEELIKNGHIRNIYSLKLGYVCFQDAKDKEIFWDIPCWVAECEWYESAKDETKAIDLEVDLLYETSAYSQIIVTAQQGKLLDPLDGSNTRSHCPPILSWNDVQ